jgi:hypothetical protein
MSPEHLTTADLAAAGKRRETSVADRTDAKTDQSRRTDDSTVPLFSEQDGAQLRARWDQVQAGFVDEPRGAVERADALVAEAISKLAEGFARTRGELDRQWKQGDQVSTEDLRVSLQRYRSFFGRLLAV